MRVRALQLLKAPIALSQAAHGSMTDAIWRVHGQAVEDVLLSIPGADGVARGVTHGLAFPQILP